MGIDSITSNNRYTDQELERLREHEGSTRSAINQIGEHAGLTQRYSVRGDDRSEREIRDAHREEVTHELVPELAKHGIEHGVEHGIEHLAERSASLAARALSGLILPLELLKEGYAMANAVIADDKVGHERAAALTKDAMHIVIMGNLNGLPQGFVDGQLGRYTESEKTSTLVRNMCLALGRDADHQAMLTIQLHCDQGMNAARAMCDANIDQTAYLASHADVAKRCAEDPAFKAGFDAAAWAKTKGSAEYDAVIKDLESRDARYERAHVAWRA